MKCADYMAAIAAKTPSGTVYATAKLLGINEQTARNWATGKSLPDAWGCVKIAETLDLPPELVIAEIEAQRTRDPAKAERWKALAGKFTSSALIVGCITIGTPAGNSLSGDGQVDNERPGHCRIICRLLKLGRQLLTAVRYASFPGRKPAAS